jgi:hypothetical protein
LRYGNISQVRSIPAADRAEPCRNRAPIKLRARRRPASWRSRSTIPRASRAIAARSIEAGNLPAAFATGALVVEDLAERRFDERALFHLINHAREERAFVLMTARSAPAAWSIAVPDLVSRLRVLPVIELAAPDDALLRAIIVKLFADRQLAVDETLVAYLAARIERSFAGALGAVDALDREALRLQRPVTRALAGELFREP